MARFGHLFLNKGVWNNRRLLGENWVDKATRTQVPATVPLGHPESGIVGAGVYGFNWWTLGARPDGRPNWRGLPSGTFAAAGHNNNDLFVVPAWSMVIVRLGLDESGDGGFKIDDATYATFLRLIGESLD
jgi:hypothetical protein